MDWLVALGVPSILAVVGGLWVEVRDLKKDMRQVRDALIRKGIIDGETAA